MLRAHPVLFAWLACSVLLASCAVDEPLVGRPLAAPEAQPAAIEQDLASESSGPVIEILVPPDAEVAPVEAAVATWLLGTAQDSAGISIDQPSLDCATTGIVQLLGPDRSIQLPDTGLNDEEIPLVGELMSYLHGRSRGAGTALRRLRPDCRSPSPPSTVSTSPSPSRPWRRLRPPRRSGQPSAT